MRYYLSVLIVLTGLQLVRLQGQDCKDPCSCGQHTFSRKFNYPVTITSKDSSGNNYQFQFSPCADVLPCGKNESTGVVICQLDPSSGLFYAIGRSSSVQWSVNASNPNHFTVIYGDGDETVPKNQVRKGSVSVNVSNQDEPSFTHIREDQLDTEIDYIFKAVIPPDEGGSVVIGFAGLVIIIILIVAVIAYLSIGAVVMYKVKGARGREVIPNFAFWKDLPFLIKDGVLFTFSPCLRICGKKTSGYSTLS